MFYYSLAAAAVAGLSRGEKQIRKAMLSLGIRVSNKLKLREGGGGGEGQATGDGFGSSGGPDAKAKQAAGECTYCDPNFMPIPGIEQALKGYDVPMGNPNPGMSI